MDQWANITADAITEGMPPAHRQKVVKMLQGAKFATKEAKALEEINLGYEWGSKAASAKLSIMTHKVGDEVNVCYSVYGFEWTMKNNFKMVMEYWEKEKSMINNFLLYKTAQGMLLELNGL